MLDDAEGPQDLNVETSSSDGAWTVRVEGELDASSAARLRSAVDDGFNEGFSSVVLSGLSVLIRAYKEAEDRDGTLTLRAPSAAVVRLLEMTGQAERFLSPEA